MPYLNWKNAPLKQTVLDRQSSDGAALAREFQMEIIFPLAPFRDELLSKLTETFDAGAGELRVDLPQEWILFWKLRDSESRLLLAHPQKEEWVATAALDEQHGKRLLSAVRAMTAGTAVVVGDLGTLGRVSNVELVLKAE